MEHTLLTPHNIALTEGIPYRIIRHLSKGQRFYDANLDYYPEDNEDLRAINEMEENLGGLSPEQADLRVVADFCCIWRYDYPQRVYDICSIIGGSSHTALRLHYQICPHRRRELTDYAEALKNWLEDKLLEDGAGQTCKKVYHFLGAKDPLKSMLAERTYLGLSARFLNCSFWGNIVQGDPVSLSPCNAQQLPQNWHQRMDELESMIRKQMGHEAGNFLCDVGGSAEPACHFKFIRRIDILVSSIGCLKWRGNLPPKDENIRGRRQITQTYLDILEKYWTGNNKLGSDKQDSKVEQELFMFLGKPDDLKKWLVACLWKNIKNQTLFHAYPMKRWVEFVRIGEEYIKALEI